MNPEDRLRQAFEARADRVEFAPDALGAIRERVGRRTHRRRALTVSFASLATGAAATVTAVVVSLVSCVPPEVTPPPPGTTSDPVPTMTTPHSGVIANLPVYFVGIDYGRAVLYREFHAQTLSEESLTMRIGAAVGIMLGGDAYDPDYRSFWPAGASVRGVELTDGVAVVDLSGTATNTVGAEQADLAVQQLVYTVTAVTAEQKVQLSGVRILLDGQPDEVLWGHVALGGKLTRAPGIEVQAPVWIISPQEGDTVPRTFDVHLSGSVFEATMALRIRNEAGAVVDERSVTLDNGPPARGEAHVSVTLAPGRYTLEGLDYSERDGSIVTLDSHAITVR